MFLASLYLLCLLVGLIWAIVATVLGGFHTDIGGHGVDAGGHEIGADSGGSEIHFSPMSPVVIATFVTAFGAMGLISTYALGVGAVMSVFFSVAVAAAIGGLVFYVFTKIFAVTQSSSEARQSDLAGTTAEVITPISAGGLGEVAYVLRGSRYTAAARTADGRAIARNRTVTIVKMVGGTMYVEGREE